MANIAITQLPIAQPLTGTESVPIVQNGVTVQTSTGAIANAPVQNQTFLTVNHETTLPNSRFFTSGLGIGITDSGAQSSYSVQLNGVSASLETSGNGFIVKTGSSVTPRSFSTATPGISISNGNGQTGNPAISLTGLAFSIATQAGNGLIALNNSSAYTPVSIVGTNNQISVLNGNGLGGNPTVSIANNPILPGNASVTVPIGTTSQRPLGLIGEFRYNTEYDTFEGYAAGDWRQFILSGGVNTFSAGTTGLLPNTPTSGAVVLSGVLNTSSGGTGNAGALTGYVKGNAASPMTAVTTIPNTDITGLGTMSVQNANAVAITGGTIAGVALTLDSLDSTPIGQNTPAAGTFTALNATTANVSGDQVATLTAAQTLTNKTINGNNNTLSFIGNSSLTNSSITINGTSVSLGGSITITASAPNALTIGTGLSGGSYNGSTPVTIAISSTGVPTGTFGSATQVGTFTVNAQGQLTSASNTSIAIPSSAITDKGLANGVATLDGTGKVPVAQLPSSVLGAVIYQGTWNAATNTPTLTSSVGTTGYYYLVSTGGTTSLNGINLWTAGDWVVFNGSIWEKVLGSSSEAFQSITVTGLTGYMYGNGTSAVTASTTIPTTALSGTISNAQLANSSVTINGNSVSLGGSTTITAVNPFALSLGTGLTGTSYNGSAAVTTAIDTTVVATLTGTQTLTNKTISGTNNTLSNIGNSSLTNSSVTINGNLVSLGGSTTVTANTPNSVTFNNGGAGAASGATFNGSSPVTISYNTVGAPSTTGTNASGTWGISITGNAATATSATNVAGGLANQIVYQTGAGATSFIATPTIASTFLQWNGSTFAWAASSGGTVTSVNASGGTTGLTFSGGPITSSGTLTLSGTLGVANGGTGVTTSSGANSVVLRDANANVSVNCLFEGFTSQAASGTQITLTASSVQNWTITGSGGQTIQLPDATTLPNGAVFTFNNNQTTGTVVIKNNSGTTICTLQSGSYIVVTLQSNSIAAGSWDFHNVAPSNASWSTNTLSWAGSYTSGTWNGNAIGAAYGGTGATSLTGYVFGNGTSAMTASTTIPNTAITGLGTMSTQNASSVTITGGTINNVTIGGTTPAAGTFTTVTATSGIYGGSF